MSWLNGIYSNRTAPGWRRRLGFRTWHPWTRSFPLFRVPFLKNPPRQCGPRTTQLFQDTKKSICKHWLMDEMLGRHRHDTTKPLHHRARSAEAWRDFAVSKSPGFHIIQKMQLRNEKRNQSTRLRNHLYSFIYPFIYVKIQYIKISGLTLSTVTNICSAAFVAPSAWVLEDRLTSSQVRSISAFPLRLFTYKHEQRIQRIQRSRVHVEVNLKKTTLRTLKATEFPWTFENLFFFRDVRTYKNHQFLCSAMSRVLDYAVLTSICDLHFLAKWNTSGTRRVHVFEEKKTFWPHPLYNVLFDVLLVPICIYLRGTLPAWK